MRHICIQAQRILCKLMSMIDIVSEYLQALVFIERKPLEACLGIP